MTLQSAKRPKEGMQSITVNTLAGTSETSRLRRRSLNSTDLWGGTSERPLLHTRLLTTAGLCLTRAVPTTKKKVSSITEGSGGNVHNQQKSVQKVE